MPAVESVAIPNPDTNMSIIYADAQRGSVDRLLTDNLRRFLRRRLIEGVAVR